VDAALTNSTAGAVGGTFKDMRIPLDRGLVARMIAAAVVTPLVVAAVLVLLVASAPTKVLLGVAIASVVGISAAVRERRERAASVELTAERAPEVHAILERLCLVADLPKPRVVLESEEQPNSWVVSLGRGRSQLHLTKGLLDRLEPAELEGVIGHELAHVAQRDAAVMTVVGGPGSVLLAGASRMGHHGGAAWFLAAGVLVAGAIGWLGSLGTRILSRYRELSADAGAVALTGNPAALAAALMKVSDGLVALPQRDLREAAARDAFHLLPTGGRGGLWLPATHPPLRVRIERLQRLEAGLHAGRR
jgi:heat shock protein HtpX